MTPFARLTRIAERLGQMPAGSVAADSTIHRALGLIGKVPPYTREEAAAKRLLPAGFEWMPSTSSGGLVYAACRRSEQDGEWPHHEAWGHTLPLAMCGAAMRARAALARRSPVPY